MEHLLSGGRARGVESSLLCTLIAYHNLIGHKLWHHHRIFFPTSVPSRPSANLTSLILEICRGSDQLSAPPPPSLSYKPPCLS